MHKKKAPGLLTKAIIMVSVLAASVMFMMCTLSSAMAATTRHTVRVGYYITPGFQEYNSNTCAYSGYSYEYILALAQYSNWNFEFVPVTFSDGVEMLKKGELDLMNNVSQSEERMQYLAFSSLPSGSNCAYLATAEDNKSIAYEDFDAFNSIRVGLVTTSIYSDKFLDYCAENGFMPELLYFDTKEDAIAAMEAGKIDARIITSSQNIDMHIIAKFAPQDFYFAVPKNETDLLHELNQAMSSLKTNDPDFELRLQKKYYSNVADGNTVFTDYENEFINENKNILVVYNASCYPLSYTDKDGSFSGTIAEIYKLLEKHTGLHFTYREEKVSNLKELATSEDIMVFAELPYDYKWAADNLVKLTPPFTDLTIMEVRRAGYNNSGGIMALVDDFYISTMCKEVYGDKYTYKSYKDTEECIDAVRNGKADFTCLTSYQGQYYQSLLKNQSLIFNVSQRLNYSLSIGMSQAADSRLFSIMIKGLNAISIDEIDSLFRETTLKSQKTDVITLLMKHPMEALPIIIVIIFLISGLLFMILHMRFINRKNAEIGQKNIQLADAVSQADRANQAKSKFLSSMSHEIRTPLNAIVGLTAIAKHHEEDPKKTDDYLSKIEASSKVLLNIINDVLDMSAIESNKLKISNEKFDIKQILNAISTIYYPQCENKKIKFSMATDVEREILVGDSLRLNQILMNLVSNAYKFTDAGGKISIIVKETEKRDSMVFFRFKVSDTGCGMSKEMLERLFKPFEQESASTAKSHGGSGLGLSIAKNLVEMMHGAISVESEKGKGTTFTVDLPFEAYDDITDNLTDKEVRKMRVLVVDDDKASLEYSTIVLERLGLSYSTAKSGYEAINCLYAAEKENNLYDICLIDWKIPDMDGVALTHRIREIESQKSIIIIVSAYDINEVEDDARAAGADHFVTKPLFQSTLFNVIMNLSKGKLKKETVHPEQYDFTGYRVLLAEDNEMNADIATELLDMVNLQLDRVDDGKKAVDLFNESKPGTYDAILMDVQMPVMDGYEAAKCIRALDRDDAKTIPIFAMTANAFAEDIAAALSAGMNGHISKPIDTKVLYDTLDEAFKSNKNK